MVFKLVFLIILSLSATSAFAQSFSEAAYAAEADAQAIPKKENQSPDVIQWCNYLGTHLRSVHKERCMSRDWKIEQKLVTGHPIPFLFWGPSEEEIQKNPSDYKKVLILSAIHGDEIASVSITFRWIDFLDRIKKDSFLRKNRFLFFPLVNPDGFYANPRTRTNKNGVDLNRNFATSSWDAQALLYWKTKTKNDPRRNPGPKAASETETQLVQKAIDTFKPDLIVSIHAPYNVVDHDGPIEFPNMKSPLPVKTLGAYPGSLGTYAGLEKGIPVVTPELPWASSLPKPKEIEDLFVFIMRAKY